jgi:ABC-2 type transport system permease protein
MVSAMNKSNKYQDIFRFIAFTAVVVLVYFISQFSTFRWDLTSEKRFSISETTEVILKDIDDIVYIKVYLEGQDLPSEFNQLKRETSILLEELRSFNKNIEFEFINPLDTDDEKSKSEILGQLANKGLIPTTILIQEDDGVQEKVIVPGALLSHNGKEVAIQLLKNNIGSNPEENLRESVNELEYEFMNAMRKTSSFVKPTIGFIIGHKELPKEEIEDFAIGLNEHYIISQFDLRELPIDSLTGEPSIAKKLQALNGFQAIIIAKPRKKFSDLDKYFIDQYIMGGGKVMWLVDGVYAEMDSLSNTGEMLAYPMRELGLEDQLFRYGVRINSNVIRDIQCAKIPLNIAEVNNQPQWQLMPWYYFPIVIPDSKHSITNNLDAIKLSFSSSIDTIKTKGIKKTILLQSSNYTGLNNAPARISLQSALTPPKEEHFKAGRKTVAMLLEGKFTSVFKNRSKPKNNSIPFREEGEPSRMIVVSDGDIVRNHIQNGKPLPLGYDRYEKMQYANKKFLLNAIDYLLEDNAVINLRSRELKLRLLDKTKIDEEYNYWKAFNTVLPIILVLLFGFVSVWLRKRKYAK